MLQRFLKKDPDDKKIAKHMRIIKKEGLPPLTLSKSKSCKDFLNKNVIDLKKK